MKANVFTYFLGLTLFLFSQASFATLPSTDDTLDNILLEVNHGNPDDYVAQLTQGDLDMVKASSDVNLKALYGQTRFFIALYWATKQPWTGWQKIQLGFFFRGLKSYATARSGQPSHRLDDNIMVNFCRYSTSSQGSSSVYGTFLQNGRWANAAEDFDTAMDTAFAIYNAANLVAERGATLAAKELIRQELNGAVCEGISNNVPSPVADLTGVVCDEVIDSVNPDNDAPTSTRDVGRSGVGGFVRGLLFNIVMGQYRETFRGMAVQIEQGARININNAAIALQRCVLVGTGSEGIGENAWGVPRDSFRITIRPFDHR